VKTGSTGHYEVVKVTYDPERISYDSKQYRYLELLDIFFAVHDPTQENGQGEDVGSQYRSAVFYLNEEQKENARKKIEALFLEGMNVATQVQPLEVFH
jgi:methionine-S-sulfoxide reductase